MTNLDAYKPGIDGPWDRPQASHLLRRAGFSPSQSQVQSALQTGLEQTVAQLVAGERESERAVELDALGQAIAARGGIDRLASWWLLRMVHTQRPLHARMSLFWHNHFATSNRNVQSPPMMLQQLRTLERHALGRFDALLLDISRDPAMIVWLDGDSNRKGKPNENYARELFELFTLGVGNYTEKDIKQAGRAFTGWGQKRGRFNFNARLHDDGEKAVLGRRGNFNGDDIVRIAVDQPACGVFIATKLLREFVNERPDAALIAEFADVIRDADFDMAKVMSRLLASKAFFEPAQYRARIKSPVEFCIGLARSFDMSIPGNALHDAVSLMGQRLFEPPGVKGWDGGRRWINSSTMLVRMNTALSAAGGAGQHGLRADEWVARSGLTDALAAIEFALSVMLDGRADENLRLALSAHAGDDPAEALRTAVATIAASPEYQLA